MSNEGTEDVPTVATTIELRNAVINTLVEQQHRTLRSIRRWIIAGFLVLLVCVGFVGVHVHLIRNTQNQHSTIVTCQNKALDGLLKDVPLAFSGDRNPRDYAPIPKDC